MNSDREAKYPFGIVVAVLEQPVKRIRNWLDHDLVKLDARYRLRTWFLRDAIKLSARSRTRHYFERSPLTLNAHDDQGKRPDRKHRRFSELDMVRMAIIMEMTTFGFSARNASRIVERFLRESKTDGKLRFGTDHAVLIIDVDQIKKYVRGRLPNSLGEQR